MEVCITKYQSLNALAHFTCTTCPELTSGFGAFSKVFAMPVAQARLKAYKAFAGPNKPVKSPTA